MTALDDALEKWLPGLTQAPAYPNLRGQLALRWVDGTRPETVVQEATLYRGKRTLTEADDPAAALTWRLSALAPLPHRNAPLPWLPDIPAALRQDTGTSDYLDRLTQRIDDLKQRVANETRQAGAPGRVPWQRTLPPDLDDQLIVDLAVWRAAHAIPSTDPSPTGPPIKEPHAARHRAWLATEVARSSPRNKLSERPDHGLEALQRMQGVEKNAPRPTTSPSTAIRP